jgi:hypothetical protein
MDANELTIRQSSGDGLRKAERIVVWDRIAEGTPDGVEEILAVNERVDATRRGSLSLGHGKK